MTFAGTSRETLTDEQLDMSEPDADPHRWSGSPARLGTLTIGAAILKTNSGGDLLPLILRTSATRTDHISSSNRLFFREGTRVVSACSL